MAGQDREGGAFFFNNRKANPNQPDYRGELRVSREVVMALQDQLQKGIEFPAIELAGWKKTSNNGGSTFISMQGKKPYEKSGSSGGGNNAQGNQGGNQWPQQGQAYGSAGGGYGAPATGGVPGLEGDDIPFNPW